MGKLWFFSHSLFLCVFFSLAEPATESILMALWEPGFAAVTIFLFFGWLGLSFWPSALSGSCHVCYGSCCGLAGCLLAVHGRIGPLGSIWAVEWQGTIIFKLNSTCSFFGPPSQPIFRALLVTPLCPVVAPRRPVPVLEMVTWGECRCHSLLFHPSCR